MREQDLQRNGQGLPSYNAIFPDAAGPKFVVHTSAEHAEGRKTGQAAT